ncbi:hypothetical protein SPRG_15520 [Saprolegnia parasitica CBS 223.65]|uniref:Uncharacterized protein n=1 Tax=Saprolegnia parasitica (strain CBS 223.65) TaxID=695850 RepID=A0A067BHG2_SAPPC|nr:hypothetical protein SPRG_15520 [Saprolegnia parasitica CBS 223.65]KDO17618.1 hypothetical protein SPRG_15520 [Saprolegnia parasitica CBS 223.65]|eukprot:XP_012211677.1 hypothetical protein SPRG_15520 [Saprolegnia parasitica CBS 223.65]
MCLNIVDPALYAGLDTADDIVVFLHSAPGRSDRRSSAFVGETFPNRVQKRMPKSLRPLFPAANEVVLCRRTWVESDHRTTFVSHQVLCQVQAFDFHDVVDVEAVLQCFERFDRVNLVVDTLLTHTEVVLRSSVAHRLRLRARNASQPSALKVLSWFFINESTGGILSTTDVFCSKTMPSMPLSTARGWACYRPSETEAVAAAVAANDARQAMVDASLHFQ